MSDKLTTRHEWDTRLRARELFLHGMSVAKIPQALADEEYERMVDEARRQKKRLPSRPEPISVSVVSGWSTAGKWGMRRSALLRDLERQQLQRVRRDMSDELAAAREQQNFLQTFAHQYFVRPALDDDGEIIRNPDGSVVLVPRGPEDWPVDDPVKLLKLLLDVNAQRINLVKTTGEMLGDFPNKLDPAGLVGEVETTTEEASNGERGNETGSTEGSADAEGPERVGSAEDEDGGSA